MNISLPAAENLSEIPVSFRAMTPTGIARLVEIDAVSNAPSWTPAMFARELELPFSIALVAETTGRTVAFGVAWAQTETVEILQIAVVPEFRRKGIGRRLLDRLIRAAKERNCQEIQLEFKEGNAAAEALYRSLGLAAVGKRKNFYPAADAVLMKGSL